MLLSTTDAGVGVGSGSDVGSEARTPLATNATATTPNSITATVATVGMTTLPSFMSIPYVSFSYLVFIAA